MSRVRRSGSIVVAAIALLGTMTATGWAQTPAPPGAGQRPPSFTATPATDKWRLTFRVGGAVPNAPSRGLSTLPPMGLTDNITFGVADRPVPSWYFGDGTTILNGNLPAGGPLVTPLDGTLTSASVAASTGAAFGVSISRALTTRYRLEFSLDGARTAATFTTAARNAIETTRASFADAFGSLFSASILHNTSVSSTAIITAGRRLEWMMSGAVEVILHTSPRGEWHATAGIGLISEPASAPTASLDGRYAFNLNSLAFAEEDRVTIAAIRDNTLFLLLGGGWTHNLSRRWGLAGDVRVALGGPGVSIQVSTRPNVTLHSPPDAPAAVTGPAVPTVLFGNFSGASTLHTTLAPFTTFVATGVQLRAELTAGLFLRF